VNEVKEVREVEDATAAWCGSRRRDLKTGLTTETQSHREDGENKKSDREKTA
jgi:hypothetical protein